MSTPLKAKGPAALERLPSHVTENLTKGKTMNIATNTTPAGAAPVTVLVPYPMQTPFMDLDQAMIRLRSIRRMIESRRSLDLEEINDITALLYDATDRLEPIGAYLNDIEYEEGHQERFIDCRRHWLIERTQGSAS